jgi:UDP-N-acetylglucosamine transferase subunit ALG13
MKGENFNIPTNKLRVLVAPLDWGLGHATRCIPIIFKLLQQNCEVIIAAEGMGKILLQKEFPGLIFIELKGYRVQYSRTRSRMPVKLMLQFPKLIYSIYAENRWLKKIVVEHKIDAVISDNRLGLHHKKIPCVYITHQLQIKTGSRFTDSIAQKIHYHFINKYSRCWVPDAAGKINLAGELSHPVILPGVPVIYLGPLSRFEKTGTGIKYELCIILSGPEPQRSIFENIILKDLEDCKEPAFLLRGLPGNLPTIGSNSRTLQIQNHLAAAELNLVLQQSKIIICRCGYTTVMDLVKLQKKAILVPTPGQTEQEYLAGYLQAQHIFYTVQQKDFSVADALKKAAAFAFKEIVVEQNKYEPAIEDFVDQALNKN